MRCGSDMVASGPPTRTRARPSLKHAWPKAAANVSIEGREALSNYMTGFQQNVKGGRFQIRSVIHHHNRMLAEWRLLGADETVLQTGRSFATIADDGRLQSITGFFDTDDKTRAT